MTTPPRSLTIHAVIGGRPVARDAVLAWEDRRITAAAGRLGVVVSGSGVAARRAALLAAKLELGPEAITARLARDVRWATRVARATRRPRGRRAISACELTAVGGSAERFATWFAERTWDPDPSAMLAACPDHFVLRAAGRRQEVLETTGGSPLATRFFVDYDDQATLVTPPDPAFAHQLAGVAQLEDGTPIGGVRHQLRDTAEGLHARLTVEFPRLTNPYMLSRHRWHLACEFSNWMEAAFA